MMIIHARDDLSSFGIVIEVVAEGPESERTLPRNMLSMSG